MMAGQKGGITMVRWNCTGSGDIETGKVELGMCEVNGNALEFALVVIACINKIDEEYHCDGALRRLIAKGLKKEVD